MELYKGRIIFCSLSLLIFLSSCSKKNLSGLYAYEEGKLYGRHFFGKQLELHKDSTFIYRATYHDEPEEDVGAPYYGYLGEGTYTANNKQITLHFRSKFRKINKIEVLPLSADEVAEIEKSKEFLESNAANASFVVFNIYFNSSYFRPKTSIGCIKVNNYRLISHYQNNIVAYNISKFPLVLNLDFEEMRHPDAFESLRFPETGGFLNFNLGFLDEVVHIDKPGRYKVNIYPFGMDSSPMVPQGVTGRWTLPLKRSFNHIKIDDLKKVNSLPQIDPK